MPDPFDRSPDAMPSDPASQGAALDALAEAPDQAVATDSGVQSPAPRPGRKRTAITAIAVVLIVLLGAGFFGFVRDRGRQAFPGLFEPDLTQVFGKEKLRVLVLGEDDNWTENDEVFTALTRSDTNIAVSIDLKSKNVGVLSIPRDLWMDIPKVGYAKLNEAIADGGPERTEATLEKNLRTPPFDYYFVLKIDATKNIVDAIGGLDVNVEKDMDYDDSWGHFHVHLKKGFQHLNGDQTVGYIRFRHDEEGDFGRMRRQRQVVQVLTARLKDPSIALHVPQLLGIIAKNVRTNMPYDKMLDLALAMRDITPQMVHTGEIPTDIGFTDGQSVLYLQPEGAAQLVHKFLVVGFDGSFDPSTVRVKVENGSGKPGAAAALADTLRQKGFTVIETGNAKRFGAVHTSIVGPNQTILAMVAKQVPIRNVKTVTGPVEGGDVEIVVGQDYRIQ